MYLEIIYSICMYKKDLALKNLQWLICSNPPPTPKKLELNNSIWPIDETLLGAITPGQSGPEALKNVDYPFIATAPRSNLAQSGSTW